MSKERLEEIEREIERSNNATLKGNSLGAERMILDLHEIGRFEWLVKHAKEQAERVQELEKFKRDVEQMYRYIHLNSKKSVREKEALQEQNKRYREALKLIMRRTDYELYPDLIQINTIAWKALEDNE